MLDATKVCMHEAFVSKIELLLFSQVLEAHPNYPRMRKDILDKARGALRS